MANHGIIVSTVTASPLGKFQSCIGFTLELLLWTVSSTVSLKGHSRECAFPTISCSCAGLSSLDLFGNNEVVSNYLTGG